MKNNKGKIDTPTAIVIAGLLVAVGIYVSNNGLSLPEKKDEGTIAGQEETQTSWVTDDEAFSLLKGYAKELGLNSEEFDSCLDSGKYQEEVQKDFDGGTKYGISGTPSFFINGKLLVGAYPYEEFEKIIEEQLSTEGPSEDAIDVSVDDDPAKGDADAPVTIVEFSEYSCPYCKMYVEETYPKIVENYVDTGKVKYVFCDFPLEFHPHAQKEAEAAECAGEQGKYWEFHDLLFARSDDFLTTQ